VIVMVRRGIAGSDRGATAVDYGLIIGGIAIVVLLAIVLLGRQVSGGMSPAAASLAASSQAADAGVISAGGPPAEPAGDGGQPAAQQPVAQQPAAQQPAPGGAGSGSGTGSSDGTSAAAATGSQPGETMVDGSGVQQAGSTTAGGNAPGTESAAAAAQPQARSMSAADWKIVNGTANIVGTTVTTTHPSSTSFATTSYQSTFVMNATPWTSPDITLTSTMRLVVPPDTPANAAVGYGVWLRATPDTRARTVPSGYTFQVDPGAGNRFVLRLWDPDPVTGQPRETTVALAPFPAGFDPYVDNEISVSLVGEQFVATVNGTEVLRLNNLADLVQAKAQSANKTYALPTGTQFGLRTWQKGDAVMSGTAVR
jgi:Flp pilus assembly pilin Flp